MTESPKNTILEDFEAVLESREVTIEELREANMKLNKENAELEKKNHRQAKRMNEMDVTMQELATAKARCEQDCEIKLHEKIKKIRRYKERLNKMFAKNDKLRVEQLHIRKMLGVRDDSDEGVVLDNIEYYMERGQLLKTLSTAQSMVVTYLLQKENE